MTHRLCWSFPPMIVTYVEGFTAALKPLRYLSVVWLKRAPTVGNLASCFLCHFDLFLISSFLFLPLALLSFLSLFFFNSCFVVCLSLSFGRCLCLGVSDCLCVLSTTRVFPSYARLIFPVLIGFLNLASRLALSIKSSILFASTTPCRHQRWRCVQQE